MHFYRVVLLAALAFVIGTTSFAFYQRVSAQQPQQRLVEESLQQLAGSRN